MFSKNKYIKIKKWIIIIYLKFPEFLTGVRNFFLPELKTPTLQFGGDGRPGKLFKLQLVAVTASVVLCGAEYGRFENGLPPLLASRNISRCLWSMEIDSNEAILLDAF
jgi:hypothetical protein